MGPPAVSLVLFVVLSLTAILPRHNMAEATSAPEDNRCSSLQKRQGLLDSRITTSGIQLIEMSSQLTHLSKQLNAQQNEVNILFDRIDSRLDGIETTISSQRVGGYTGCQDALTHGQNTSGVYTISPDQDNSFNVYCEQQLDGGGWTVFQFRKHKSIDFYQDWNTYKLGFGNFTGEFWLGNRKINLLTRNHDQQLKIELVPYGGEVKYADYREFWIGDEAHYYKLHISGYSEGDPPGDAMASSNGSSFSTKDQDHDVLKWKSCAKDRYGAWWYNKDCSRANLNGRHLANRGEGIHWLTWKNWNTSMKMTRMMVRKRA